MNNLKEPDARTLLVAAEEKVIREEIAAAIAAEPVAWRLRLPDGSCTAWFDGKPPKHHGPYEVAFATPPVRDDLIYAILIKHLPKDATLDNIYQDLKEGLK